MGKFYFCIFGMILFVMITVPLIAVKQDAKTVSANAENVKKDTEKKALKSGTESRVKVYLADEKETVSVSLEEYLVGVVACEMDESYEQEALKAQAVTAHTLLLQRKAENSDKKYDITSSSATDQGYLTESGRKKKYGDQFANCEAMFTAAVAKVKDKVIYYSDKPILAVYHDTSSGKTEDAENIWGGDYPYLKSVESASDMLNPEYLSTVTYTAEEFRSQADSLGITLKGSAEKYIGSVSTTDCGTVKKIKIGGKSFTGQEIRTAFNLRSANFDLSYSDKKFVFSVRGFGHGVGMSQYGANFMAESGSSYEDIIKWYYKNVEIKG